MSSNSPNTGSTTPVPSSSTPRPAQSSAPVATPSTATYPYSAYGAAYVGHPIYAQPSPYTTQPGTPGGYQYVAGMYQPGVTGYWPYQYGYPPHHIYTPRPQVPQTQGGTTAATYSTPSAASARPATTFSSYTPSQPRDGGASTTAGGGSKSSKKQSNMKGLFTKELKSLMYGFGDDRNPANDTVNVMEEILVEYIMDVCQVAGGPTRKGRLSIEDLRRALSLPADAKKLARMEELLFMQEDIKRARAQFNEAEVQQSRIVL